MSTLFNAKEESSDSIHRTPSKAKNLACILLYCNIISITYSSRTVTYVSKFYEHCRNAEVSLRKNRLQGGNVLRQNGVRNKWSMRKYKHGAHITCSQCFVGKEGGNEGHRKGDEDSKEGCVVLQSWYISQCSVC